MDKRLTPLYRHRLFPHRRRGRYSLRVQSLRLFHNFSVRNAPSHILTLHAFEIRHPRFAAQRQAQNHFHKNRSAATHSEKSANHRSKDTYSFVLFPSFLSFLPGCSRRSKTSGGNIWTFYLCCLFILGRTNYVQNRNNQAGSVVKGIEIAAKHV